MFLKIAIVVLFILMIASLFGALNFLLKDSAIPVARRSYYLQGVRVTLALLLMVLVFYGLATGQLHSHAPWDHNI